MPCTMDFTPILFLNPPHNLPLADRLSPQSSRLTPTRFVYFVHHLASQLDDVHSPNADPCASTNLHLAHRIHKKTGTKSL